MSTKAGRIKLAADPAPWAAAIGERCPDCEMAKRKPEITMKSFGIYTKWNSGSKDLPRVYEFTTRVLAEIDVEFGFVVNIKGAKNQKLNYCIFHPDIPDADGAPRPPFDGTVHVRTNDWDFYLGDTIWEPIHDKLGDWRMTLEMNGRIIAEKTFELHDDVEGFA